ncbi:MAG: uroporphyrinogen-III C-methyltransferase, partial [Giesbergeria sp.]
AIEARALARQASELAQESSARLAVQETRLSEVALQRSQLEELMQSLSRSRDENLVVDIEANVRLAQQQAQLTGSVQPLVASIKSAQQRIERAAQPRLAPVQRALALDLERLASASVTDTAGLLARLDELLRQVDELPLKNAVAQAAATRRLAASVRPAAASAAAAGEASGLPAWMAPLQRGWEVVKDEMRGLVRVRRIDQPAADAGQFDSESLWRSVGASVQPGHRVLIVRGSEAGRDGAGSGRDWLSSQIRAAGGSVDFVVAYTRAAPPWSPEQRALAQVAATDGTLWVLSSAQALGHLCAALPDQSWAGARALATHPRIAQAALAAGFGQVLECRPALADVAASIESAP